MATPPSAPRPPAIKYQNGQTEQIPFPDLDIVELYSFVDFLVAGRTPEIVALNARRNLEWVKSLDLGCYNELARFCIRKNFPMAMEIATADPIAGLKVGPLLLQIGAFMKSSSETSPASAATPASAAPSGASSPAAPGPQEPLAVSAPSSATLPPSSASSSS